MEDSRIVKNIDQNHIHHLDFTWL